MNTRNGKYVEVSQSDKGMKSFVKCDHMTPEQLKSYLGANNQIQRREPQANVRWNALLDGGLHITTKRKRNANQTKRRN